MSVSRAESCLRMPNISSCLRIVDAFSTSSSSANETSSAGVLAFSSWSFISRIQNVLWKLGRQRVGKRDAADWKRRRSAVGLGLRGALGVRSRCTSRLQSTGARTQLHPPTFGWDSLKIRKQSASGKRPDVLCTSNAIKSKRFQHHKEHDDDHR